MVMTCDKLNICSQLLSSMSSTPATHLSSGVEYSNTVEVRVIGELFQ